jgi:glycosyltransferase
MRISVITVSFNCAATIRDTLQSVATQSHNDIEHIVVDGASRDGTVELVSVHGAHLEQFVSEPDEGIYDAMNKGVRLATGEMIGFLNGDDTFAYADAIADIARVATENAEADAVFGDLVYVDQNHPERVIRRWRTGGFSRSKLRFGWMPPHPTFYLRRRGWDQLGLFDTKLRIAADYDFLLRCLSRPGTKAAYIDKVLVRMRVGGVSNRSIQSMYHKSREDLVALRTNHIGGLLTLAFKNLRKIPQFLGGN